METTSIDKETLLTILTDFLEVMHDGICITDGEGTVLRISDTCREIYDIEQCDCVGRHISELEVRGTFAPSVTLQVIREGHKVTNMQPDKNGQQLLVTGVPIFDGNGNILFVISYASWDIASIGELKRQYNELQEEVKRYSMELERFRIREMGSGFVAESRKMQQLRVLLDKVATTDVSVLITGENGSGKLTAARHLHRVSRRAEGPFVKLTAGAFPVHVLEDELFGYVQVNQSTGIEQEKIGLCELAHGGTLVLEDVECLSPDTQGKLLHLIQNQYYFKPGSKEVKNVDVRLVATTTQDLENLVRKGQFREELFYRLSVVPIHVPSLKERKEDIVPLIHNFLQEFGQKYQREKRISQQAMDLLLSHPWPGNVRELKYMVERLVLTTEEDVIQGYSLPGNISPFAASNYEAEIDLNSYLDYHEGRLVKQAWEKCHTTVGVARFLGISQASAVRKLQKFIPEYSTGKRAIHK